MKRDRNLSIVPVRVIPIINGMEGGTEVIAAVESGIREG
jgi:hypothetical protein